MKQYIYVGKSEGKHWAVESEREKPFIGDFKATRTESAGHQFDKAVKEYVPYLASLPPIECSPELVQGLKPGDELPESEKQEQVKYKHEGNQWRNCEHHEYSMAHVECRRIILVPAKQEQEEKKTLQKIREERGLSINEVENGANLPHGSLAGIESGKHKSANGIYHLCSFYKIEYSRELLIEYGLIVKREKQWQPITKPQEQVLYDCEHCGWSGTEVKTIRLEDRCPRCNSLDINTYRPRERYSLLRCGIGAKLRAGLRSIITPWKGSR